MRVIANGQLNCPILVFCSPVNYIIVINTVILNFLEGRWPSNPFFIRDLMNWHFNTYLYLCMNLFRIDPPKKSYFITADFTNIPLLTDSSGLQKVSINIFPNCSKCILLNHLEENPKEHNQQIPEKNMSDEIYHWLYALMSQNLRQGTMIQIHR